MPALILGLIVSGLAVLAFTGRPVLVLRVLIGTTVLLPATLIVPGSPTSALTAPRFVLLGALAGLIVRVWRGGLPRRIFALTSVHVAWAVNVGAVVVAGVWFAPFDVVPQDSILRLLDVVDQPIVLVVCLALMRLTGVRPAAVAITVALTAAALIMVFEHVTEVSWGRFLFADLPGQTSIASLALEQRDGGVRARAGSEFALQAGWMLATALPLLLVNASLGGRLRRTSVPVVVVVMLAEVWTVSRSPLGGIVAAAVLVLVLSRAQAAQHLALAFVGVGAVALAGVASLARVYSQSLDQGSIDVRGDRLPFVLGLAADQPLLGQGLGGLRAVGVGTTDITYLLTYVELGVVGLSALLVLLAVTVVACARVLRLAPGESRSIGVAALAGVLVLLAGGLSFEALQGLQTAYLLQVFVALAVVAVETELGPSSLPRPFVARALLPAIVGVGVGAIAASLAPVHSAQTSRLLTVPAFREAGVEDPVAGGRIVVNNACAFIDERATSLPARIRCTDLKVAAGVGQLRVEAADDATVVQVTDLLLDELRQRGLVFASIEPETGIERGKPTLVATAPVWAGFLFLGLLLLPARIVRRDPAVPFRE